MTWPADANADVELLGFELVVDRAIDTPSISALELAEMLSRLRAAYVMALDYLHFTARASDWQQASPPVLTGKRLQVEFDGMLHHMVHFGTAPVQRLSRMRLPPELDLRFTAINSNSPLKFMGYCTGIALLGLSLAVMLAGGEADLGTVARFKVGPAADVILRIADAFRQSH